MSAYLVTMVEAAANIDVLTASEVVDGDGDQRLREIVIEDRHTGRRRTYPTGALFVLIGATPHTAWLPETVARDRRGFVFTGQDVALGGRDGDRADGRGGEGPRWPLERPPLALETSLPGVFAVADVRHGSTKRVASAVGDGALVVNSVHELLRAPHRLRPAA